MSEHPIGSVRDGTYAETETPGTPATAIDKSTTAQTKAGKLTLSNTEFVLGLPNAVLAAGTHLYTRKPAGQVAANWYELIASTAFESDLYRDHTFNFGFGREATGAKVAGEVLLYEQFETKFRETPGDPYKAEWHLNFGRPADSGVLSRPIKIDMYHVSGLNDIFFSGNVKLLGSTGGVVRYDLSETGGFQMWNNASMSLQSQVNGAALATNIQLLTTAGFPSIRLRNAAEDTVVLTMSASSKALIVEALGGTTIRNVAAASAKKCLVLTAGSTQATHMLEIQASDQFTRWSYFNKVGRFHTAVATAPVLADLADGEMALSTDASGNLIVTSRVSGALKAATVVVI